MASRFGSVAELSGPKHRPAVQRTIKPQTETGFVKACVGRSRDKAALLTRIKSIEVRLKFKASLVALKTHIRWFAVDFAPSSKRLRQESDRIDCVALAAIVLAYEDGQVLL